MEYEFGHCLPGELPELNELVNRIFRGRRPGDMAAEYPLLFDPENVENLRVARKGGKLVAHVGISLRDASILGARVRVASIGAVGTDPEHRGQGLASRLMTDARRHAVEEGASLMLISGGRGLYHRLGYVQVGAFDRYRVSVGEGELPDDLHVRPILSENVRPVRPEEVRLAAWLHQLDPVRFYRGVEDWRKLIEAGMLMNQPADLLLLEMSEVPVAYAAVQRPGPPGSGSPERPRVLELGGSRFALGVGLPVIAHRYQATELELVVPGWDLEWLIQAAAFEWPSERIPFPGTLGIIDPERFLTAIRPLLEERCRVPLRIEPAGEGARLEAGGQTAELGTMGQLTALVFGGDTEEARAVPDLPGPLKTAARHAFPLPLLWPGYNYV